ncbi:unnamed protein product [Linum tenue]|uniref:Uncharacterized protein n=1 Tax=Linum tenue TaxID=586396 RepID=A0AAV0S6Q9_9ROSI|nr:unnamed protein product [Linum tenue]
MVGIGPLVDLTTSNIDDVGSVKYMTWLDSRATSSVVYVSFGTMIVLSRRQKEEVGKALLSSGRSFLWTLRKESEKEEEEEESRWREEMEKEAEECGGMIVEWCSQVDFSDQQTNAKLVEDVWRTGVRVVVPETGAVVEGEEIRRCLELVMGEGEVGEEVRRNAKKWKELARSAAGEGGTSHVNLKGFVDEIASYS